MRKINLVFIFIGLMIFTIVILNFLNIQLQYMQLFIYPVFMIFAILMGLKYFEQQSFSYQLWVNPILQLSILLIKLDGVEKFTETKRIIKYLNSEFDPVTVKFKLKYYKKQLKLEQSISKTCRKIKDTNSSKEKVRVLQHLIRLAITDRLLSDKEFEFLQKVTKKIGLHKRTLNAILQLHIYVTEEDIRNQKLNKSYVNSSSKRAFSILGLESNATMDEVKDAHRELVKIYHPDKLNKNERNKEQAKIKFQAITDAYQFLKNELN